MKRKARKRAWEVNGQNPEGDDASCVATNSIGGVGANYGRVVSNYGRVGRNYGRVVSNYGRVGRNYGGVGNNYGRVGANYGGVGNKEGSGANKERVGAFPEGAGEGRDDGNSGSSVPLRAGATWIIYRRKTI